ncbi:MAG: acyl-CoA dehydrogenase family protein [Gammaproteobacteria bacterium]
MDFDLSPEQSMLYESVRRFCDESAPPLRLLRIYDGDEPLDRALWTGMAGIGLAGMLVPEDFGGAGLGMLDTAVAAEALGYCAAPGPFLGHTLAAMALSIAGSPGQRRHWLPRLASGEIVATLAASEGGERWLPDAWTLAPAGNRLSGTKTHVPFAADADLFIVGLRGGALALVERGASGLAAQDVDGIDRTRRIGTLRLQDTPCEILPGAPDAADRIRDAALLLLAADAYGGAWRSVEFTVDYLKTREQFGRPLASFQGIKHQVADMAAEVRPSQSLHWYAAYAFDRRPDEAPRMAALAKAHNTERFLHASRRMVELHGGIGYTWKFHCQAWVKRAMFDHAFFGMPALHRERAAALAGW